MRSHALALLFSAVSLACSVLSLPPPTQAQVDCGQTSAGAQPVFIGARSVSANAQVTIDYAVFYTPEARDTQGGSEAMLTRIQSAFEGANQLYVNSGAAITHRVVHTQELPLNNTSETLPELGTELATGFDFFSVMDATQADSFVIVVKFQRPGGYANIPLSPSQASRGGGIYLGLPNLSGGVLAHEMGHTLGAGHDYADGLQARFFIPPNYNHGNHFIGASSGNCYRTIMSALASCRLAGYQGVPALAANVFSNPLLLYEGTPTGDPEKADAVRMFTEFAPFVANTRGTSAAPEPTPTPDEGDENPDDSDQEDLLTLKLKKNARRIIASGTCRTADGAALNGDSIALYLLNARRNTEKLLQRATCTEAGNYRARLDRTGRFQARNERTGSQSGTVRLR